MRFEEIKPRRGTSQRTRRLLQWARREQVTQGGGGWLQQRLSDAVYRRLLADQHDQRRPASPAPEQVAGEVPQFDCVPATSPGWCLLPLVRSLDARLVWTPSQ
jgi:hypothetical protein